MPSTRSLTSKDKTKPQPAPPQKKKDKTKTNEEAKGGARYSDKEARCSEARRGEARSGETIVGIPHRTGDQPNQNNSTPETIRLSKLVLADGINSDHIGGKLERYFRIIQHNQ